MTGLVSPTDPIKGVDVSRTWFYLPFVLAMTAWPSLSASADTVAAAAISYAEQPVRLLRDTGFYLAPRGTRLQSGDIVESGASSIRIDGVGASASSIALGPASQLYFKAAPKGVEIVLLTGWMKIQAPRGATPSAQAQLLASSGGIRLDASSISVILHASPGKTELFVEDGELLVDELQGGKPLRTKVSREQYAVRTAKLPLKLIPRPPKEFLGAMPLDFLDALAPVALKGPPPVPKVDRPAQFADVAPWVADEPAVRQLLHLRFYPPPKAQQQAPQQAPRAPDFTY
jgi:hypothetical protein